MFRQIRSLLLVAMIVIAGVLPASAQETSAQETLAQETETSTATTAATTENTFKVPAVSIPDLTAQPEAAPWTTKFLVPTGIALAAVAIFATVIQYFLKVVRNRYKAVE